MVQNNVASCFVIRDYTGQPIIVDALNLGEVTIHVTEAMALREALQLCKTKGPPSDLYRG